MNKPSWFQTNLNLGNILTLGAMLLAGAYGYGQLTERIDGKFVQVSNDAKASTEKLGARIDNIEAFRIERVRQTDAKFADIAQLLQALPNLTYRVTAQEEAMKATNARVDQSLSNISARLAEINVALGNLDTRVAVLTQRFDSAQPQRRAEAGRAPGG